MPDTNLQTSRANSQAEGLNARSSFYIRRGKNAIGPLTVEQLQHVIRTGQIGGDYGVSSTERGPWRLVRDVPQLADLLSRTQLPASSPATHNRTSKAVTSKRERPSSIDHKHVSLVPTLPQRRENLSTLERTGAIEEPKQRSHSIEIVAGPVRHRLPRRNRRRRSKLVVLFTAILFSAGGFFVGREQMKRELARLPTASPVEAKDMAVAKTIPAVDEERIVEDKTPSVTVTWTPRDPYRNGLDRVRRWMRTASESRRDDSLNSLRFNLRKTKTTRSEFEEVLNRIDLMASRASDDQVKASMAVNFYVSLAMYRERGVDDMNVYGMRSSEEMAMDDIRMTARMFGY